MNKRNSDTLTVGGRLLAYPRVEQSERASAFAVLANAGTLRNLLQARSTNPFILTENKAG
jgi:hypothetical protein